MKKIALFAVAAMTGLLLVACGESGDKKPEKVEVTVEQPAAAPAEPAVAEPAAEAPAAEKAE